MIINRINCDFMWFSYNKRRISSKEASVKSVVICTKHFVSYFPSTQLFFLFFKNVNELEVCIDAINACFCNQCAAVGIRKGQLAYTVTLNPFTRATTSTNNHCTFSSPSNPCLHVFFYIVPMKPNSWAVKPQILVTTVYP